MVSHVKDIMQAEYCFSCSMNGWQHPCLDRNIHSLLAVVTALCNTCGGIVLLTQPENLPQPGTSQFEEFKKRLFPQLEGVGIPQKHLTLFRMSACDEMWAVLTVPKAPQCLPYIYRDERIHLYVDVFGLVQQQEYVHQHPVSDVGPGVDEPGTSGSFSPFHNAKDTIADVSTEYNMDSNTDDVANATETDMVPTVEFGVYQKLEWPRNKKNGGQILKEYHEESLDDFVNTCSIWKPCVPMTVTPERESLMHFFASQEEFEETLGKVDPGVPAFAIASRCWTSLLPLEITQSQPPHHVCDILTVATDAKVCLWVIVARTNGTVVQEQRIYMWESGRMIKRQILTTDERCQNLSIQCKLLDISQSSDLSFLEENSQATGATALIGQLAHKFLNENSFKCLQTSIALLLLSKESLMKTCIGNQLSLKLSMKQARAIIKGAKVNYITGPAGSGKTLCGISLYRTYGGDCSIYICTTVPLLQYLKYNECIGTLIRSDEDLCHHIAHGTFRNIKCVVIDDSHNLTCTRCSLEKLFLVLKDTKDMCLYVFADNEYQSFDRKRQQEVQDCIYNLTRQLFGRYPRSEDLTEIYRNPRKVVSFLQHTIQGESFDSVNVVCANPMDGYGIECITMENIWINDRGNELVKYLRPLIFADSEQEMPSYPTTDVAILLDAGFTDKHITQFSKTLQNQFPGISTHSAAEFPRRGVVIDTVDSFVGLDASLCIFILFPSDLLEDSDTIPTPSKRRHLEASTFTGVELEQTIANPRYRVFLASRSTHRAVFVVPHIDEDLIKYMKFDFFHVSFHNGCNFRHQKELVCRLISVVQISLL